MGRTIDINYHILKEEFDTVPTDYFNSFTTLSDKGVIDKEFATELARSVGLRNALAHEYDAIDDAQVYGAIKMCLIQVPKYLDIILERFTS